MLCALPSGGGASSRARLPSPSWPVGNWPSGRRLRTSCAGCLPVRLFWAPSLEAQGPLSPLCPCRTEAAEGDQTEQPVCVCGYAGVCVCFRGCVSTNVCVFMCGRQRWGVWNVWVCVCVWSRGAGDLSPGYRSPDFQRPHLDRMQGALPKHAELEAGPGWVWVAALGRGCVF